MNKPKYVIEEWSGQWNVVAVCATYELAIQTLADMLRKAHVDADGHVWNNGHRVHSVAWNMPGFE